MDGSFGSKEYCRLNPKTALLPLFESAFSGLKDTKNLQYLSNTFLDEKYDIKILGFRGTLFDLITTFTILIKDLRTCDSFTNFVLGIITFLKNLTGLSFTDIYHFYGTMLSSFAQSCFQDLTTAFKNTTCFTTPEAQSDTRSTLDFISSLKDVLSNFSKIKNSVFSSKFVTFLSLVVCTPICKKLGIDVTWFGFNPLYQRACEKNYHRSHSISVVHDILDSSLYLIEKLVMMFDSKSANCLYIDDEDILAYDTEFTFLTYYYDRLELLSNHDISLMDYYTRCDALLEKGIKLKAYYSEDKSGMMMIKNHQNMLAKCKLRCGDKMRVASEREPPLALILHGTPGIGKSALIDKLLTICYQNAKYLKHTSLDYDPKMKYVYNHDDEYMSEFRSNNTVCIIDDVDQFIPDITKQDGGGALRHSISFINPVPYVTNQAELANKGMIPFLCDYVIMTTNTHDAGISKVFQDHGGARRRFMFLDIVVKPEFRKPGQTQLAGDKENPFNHELHEFQPRKYESVGNTHNEVYWHKDSKTWCDNPGIPMSLKELSQFLLTEVQEPHYRQNALSKDSVTQFIEAPFCEACKCSTALCGHPQAEAGVLTSVREFSYKLTIHYFSAILYLAFGLCYFQYLFLFSFLRIKSNRSVDLLSKMIWILPDKTPRWCKYTPKGFQKFVNKELWLWWMFSKGQHQFGNHLFSYSNVRRNVKLADTGVKTLLQLIVACMFFIKFKNLFKNKPSADTEGAYISKKEEEPVSDDKNYWRSKTVDLSSLKGPQSTTTFEQLQQAVRGNVCKLKLYINDNEYFCTNGFGLYGNTLCIAAHMLDAAPLYTAITIIRHDQDQKIGPSRYKLILSSDNILRHKDSDIALIRHSGFGTFRDIRKFIAPKVKDGIFKGIIMTRELDGIITTRRVDGVRNEPLKYAGYGKIYTGNGYKGFLTTPTSKGDCGSPYICTTLNGHFIAGIHVGGNTKTMKEDFGLCQPIISFEFTDNRFIPHSFNGLDLNTHYSTNQDLSLSSELHPKSPINEVEGAGEVYGALDIHVSKPKSFVQPTIMAQDVLSHYDLDEFTHFSPKEVSARRAVQLNVGKCLIKAQIDTSTIFKCEDGLYTWYSNTIKATGVKIPSGPYGIDVGINGIDGVSYVDRLPVKTSGGFAHKGAKLKYFVSLPSDEDHEVQYDLVPEIKAEYDRLLSDYKAGLSGNVIFDYNYKDEPLSASKVKRNKCRLFSSGPLHFTVMVRQYFLWCIPLFSGKNRHKYGHAIGANCVGTDWDTIYKHITKHGENKVIAGDYGSYDKVMPPEVMCSAFNVLIRIAEDHGWSKEDLTVMRGLATDICYPKTNVFGSVIGFFGTNPSGHSLTTPINGMCNILYIMMACHDICEQQGKEHIDLGNFLDYVSIITYGDDNAMSSKYDYINHTALSTALAARGIEYTMADKESESVPFINISQVDFLKRKFVLDQNIKGKYSAPLDEASIIKMLSICTKSRSILFETQCAAIIDSASREYFQYGEKTFKEKKAFLDSILEKHNLWQYLPKGRLDSYEEHLASLESECQGGFLSKDPEPEPFDYKAYFKMFVLEEFMYFRYGRIDMFAHDQAIKVLDFFGRNGFEDYGVLRHFLVQDNLRNYKRTKPIPIPK